MKILITLTVLLSFFKVCFTQTIWGASYMNSVMQNQIISFKNNSQLQTNINFVTVNDDNDFPVYTMTQSKIQIIATDLPITQFQISNIKNSLNVNNVFHFPYVITGMTIIYNLPELLNFNLYNLNLTADIINDIYNGFVSYWIDSSILKVNPYLQYLCDNNIINLSGKKIIPGFRSDMSSTTYELTDFLKRHSSEYKGPVSLNYTNWSYRFHNENDGGKMASWVKDIPYSFSYAKKKTALNKNCQIAALLNKNNRFVYPSDENFIKTVEQSVVPLPIYTNWNTLSMGTDSIYLDKYPSTHFGYLITYDINNMKLDLFNKTVLNNFLVYLFANKNSKFYLPKFYIQAPDNILNINFNYVNTYINPNTVNSAFKNLKITHLFQFFIFLSVLLTYFF